MGLSDGLEGPLLICEREPIRRFGLDCGDRVLVSVIFVGLTTGIEGPLLLFEEVLIRRFVLARGDGTLMYFCFAGLLGGLEGLLLFVDVEFGSILAATRMNFVGVKRRRRSMSLRLLLVKSWIGDGLACQR